MAARWALVFRVDVRVLIDRATMNTFGIRLGEVTLSFTRPVP